MEEELKRETADLREESLRHLPFPPERRSRAETKYTTNPNEREPHSRMTFVQALPVQGTIRASEKGDTDVRSSAPLESNLTIYGSGFGAAQGSSYVLIGGRFVTVMAWTDGAIYVLVNP